MTSLDNELEQQQLKIVRILDLSMFPEGTICLAPASPDPVDTENLILRLPNAHTHITSRDIRLAFLANKDINFIAIRWLCPASSSPSHQAFYCHRHHFNLDAAE